MIKPAVPDNVAKMWQDPRFEILTQIDILLHGSKVWKGTEWNYHPISPVKYRPVAEKMRKALDDLYNEYGVEE